MENFNTEYQVLGLLGGSSLFLGEDVTQHENGGSFPSGSVGRFMSMQEMREAGNRSFLFRALIFFNLFFFFILILNFFKKKP